MALLEILLSEVLFTHFVKIDSVLTKEKKSIMS